MTAKLISNNVTKEYSFEANIFVKKVPTLVPFKLVFVNGEMYRLDCKVTVAPHNVVICHGKIALTWSEYLNLMKIVYDETVRIETEIEDTTI